VTAASRAERAGTAPATGSGAAFAVELTDAGAQTLVPGVTPITARDRLRWRADAPLSPPRPQQPCDLGLFDLAARAQLDLFIHAGD
jgi:hypothetical protein